ncbi:hypothetical protein LTR08_006605 [Meristemomyces frigidus]|nr:hypothetical protein LTR08_006605 [Meristemomyces frigidus]
MSLLLPSLPLANGLQLAGPEYVGIHTPPTPPTPPTTNHDQHYHHHLMSPLLPSLPLANGLQLAGPEHVGSSQTLGTEMLPTPPEIDFDLDMYINSDMVDSNAGPIFEFPEEWIQGTGPAYGAPAANTQAGNVTTTTTTTATATTTIAPAPLPAPLSAPLAPTLAAPLAATAIVTARAQVPGNRVGATRNWGQALRAHKHRCTGLAGTTCHATHCGLLRLFPAEWAAQVANQVVVHEEGNKLLPKITVCELDAWKHKDKQVRRKK